MRRAKTAQREMHALRAVQTAQPPWSGITWATAWDNRP